MDQYASEVQKFVVQAACGSQDYVSGCIGGSGYIGRS